MDLSRSAQGIGEPARSLAYLPSQAASPQRESRNIDCVSARGTENGALSWLNSGDPCSMFAKCAACPPSCISVVSAVFPLPTSSGVAREVKFACDAFQVPSCALCGAMGQWQKPFGYLPLRSQRSSCILVSRYLMPMAAKDRPQTSGAFSKGK